MLKRDGSGTGLKGRGFFGGWKEQMDRQRQLIPLASATLMQTLEHEGSFFEITLLVVLSLLLSLAKGLSGFKNRNERSEWVDHGYMAPT